jgi:hypothetical protein
MGKIGEKLGLYRRKAVLVMLWRDAGIRGIELPLIFLFLDGLPAAFHAEPCYSLLTAADEKIALPVVHVNNKPQYLVFR